MISTLLSLECTKYKYPAKAMVLRHKEVETN